MHVAGPFEEPEDAWSAARAAVRERERRSPRPVRTPAIEAVGRFLIPPPGAPSRPFQILHLDFGLPVDPRSPTDVGRYTALHVPAGAPQPTAETRIVPLAALLGQRGWPEPGLVVDRLRRYGTSRGGVVDGDGYVEGILARLVEAAGGGPPWLPRVGEDGMLCGQEFDDLAAEAAHFRSHGLRLELAEQRVRTGPGELLLIDNLATAHGRVGSRRPEELHQLVLGHPELAVSRQELLRDGVLRAFAA